MPKLDGMGVMKRIKQLSEKPTVIVYSVSALQRTIEKCHGARCGLLLIKTAKL